MRNTKPVPVLSIRLRYYRCYFKTVSIGCLVIMANKTAILRTLPVLLTGKKLVNIKLIIFELISLFDSVLLTICTILNIKLSQKGYLERTLTFGH